MSYPPPSPDQQPGYPQQPGFPAQPGYPQQPGYPAQPGYPVQPGYPTQSGYPGQPVPPAPKKSRAGLWIGITLGVLLLCCGGGVGGWYLLKDTADQLEQGVEGALASASAQAAAKEITVVAPATLAGRPKSTDPQLETVTDTMKSSFEAMLPSATGAVAAFYGDQAKQDLVMIFAAASRITDPGREVDAAFTGMGTSGVVATGIVPVDAGPLGGEAKCGSAKTESVPLVVCAWADKGSLGMVVWYFKTVNEVKAEFIEVRGQIEQVG